MSDAFSTAITQSEDTSGAIEELKSRGMRIRDRGLRVLGVAGAAAVMAVGAFLLYMNIEPMSAFTTIDLPALSESVASITPGPGGMTSPFNTAFDSLRGVLTGALPKALAVVAILISGIVGAASGRMTTALTGLMMAFPILFLPTVLDIVAPGGGSPAGQQANGNSFLHQLVEEKRYKELTAAAGELMPLEQAAYVKAQIAYLTKDGDTLKEELDTLATGKLEKWTPNWERMNVLETEAFGAPKIKGTVAFADDVHSSLATRQKIYGSSGALAIVAGIIGGALFGFGMMLVRRARRLEEMLGLNRKVEAQSVPALEDVRSQPIEFEKIPKPEFVPAWQRPVQSFTREPVASPSPVESSGPSMVDGLLVGAAAGMVASAILDDDRPSRHSSDCSSTFYVPTDSSPVSSSIDCSSGGDCGGGGGCD